MYKANEELDEFNGRKMKLLTIFAGLLVICGSATAGQYDEAIGAAFPGYRIVQPSERWVPKERPEDYEKERNAPAVVVGRFNQDAFQDFAAFVLNPAIKDIYSTSPGGLAVCFGQERGRYRCQLVPPFRDIQLPHSWYLERVPPGTKQTCRELARIRPWEPETSKRFAEHLGEDKTIHITTDAVAASSMTGNERHADRIMVFQPDGSFLDCSFGH